MELLLTLNPVTPLSLSDSTIIRSGLVPVDEFERMIEARALLEAGRDLGSGIGLVMTL
ncbi:MAG: hypothetical protein WD333_03980 [Dehalococcoidia bacterium]